MNNLAGVQTSIFSALTTAPETYHVYDAVPQGTAKPYIVIGEYTGEPDEALDTMTTDASLTIHTWSARPGKAETHAMLEFVRTRLDGETIAGAWLTTEDFVEIMEDQNSTAASRLYHGIARYRIRIEDGVFLPDLGQFDDAQFA